MSDPRSEYAGKIPLEVRLAVDGLSGSNDVGYAVVVLLVEEESLQFGEIREKLDVHQQTLTNTLDELQRGGVVKKRAGERIGDQSTGAYTLTKFGDRILDGLYYASEPEAQWNPISVRELARRRAERMGQTQGDSSSGWVPIDEMGEADFPHNTGESSASVLTSTVGDAQNGSLKESPPRKDRVRAGQSQNNGGAI